MENKEQQSVGQEPRQPEQLKESEQEKVEPEVKVEPVKQDVQKRMEEVLQQPAVATPAAQMKPMKKKHNVAAMLLAVVALVGIGAAAYFGMQYFNEKDRADKLAKQNTAVVAAENTTGTEGDDKDAATAAGSVSYGFDANKIVNGDNNKSYTLSGTSMSSGVGVGASKDQKTVSINLSTTYLNQQGFNVSDSNANKDVQFQQKVIDVFNGGSGQDITGNELLFLLEDGTVQHLSLKDMTNNKWTPTVIKGLNNIVKFYVVSETPTDSPVGGGMRIAAQDREGKIYIIGGEKLPF